MTEDWGDKEYHSILTDDNKNDIIYGLKIIISILVPMIIGFVVLIYINAFLGLMIGMGGLVFVGFFINEEDISTDEFEGTED